jgi:hypothetical protein
MLAVISAAVQAGLLVWCFMEVLHFIANLFRVNAPLKVLFTAALSIVYIIIFILGRV